MQDLLSNLLTLAIVLVIYFAILRPRMIQRQKELTQTQTTSRQTASPRKPESIWNRAARHEYTAKFPSLADELNELRDQFREGMLAAGTSMREINLLWNPIA